MADKKISALTAATTPLAGTEVLPIVQGGATVKVSVDNLTAGRSASFATVDTTNIEVTNLKAKDGTAAGSIADSTGVVTLASSVLTTTDINGGTIDGVTIGGASAGAVSSTNLAYTGTFTGGTGVVNLGSGQFYKDASGNVGIGTASPTGKLDLFTSATGGSISTLTFSANNAASAKKDYVQFVPAIEFSTASSEAGGYTLKLLQQGAYKNSIVASGITNNSSNYLAFSTTNEAMRIDSTGIVTMNAYGAGAATFSAAGVISSVSDETWKIKDGVPVDPDSMLKKLEPGYWFYNEEKALIFGNERQLGFYAQNVNAAIGPEAAPQPEVVTTKALDGTDIVTPKPWGYYDRSVLAVAVMSLQKALATIESLTARIETLEAK
jgi:hypothetical protein